MQDVYEWAGELRTVDMRKGRDPAAEFLKPVSRLNPALTTLPRHTRPRPCGVSVPTLWRAGAQFHLSPARP